MNNTREDRNQYFEDACNEICKAYADCNRIFKDRMNLRNLDFRSSYSLTKEEAVIAMTRALSCSPSERAYNAFKPELISRLPEASIISVAREGSVCLYVTCGPLSHGEQIALDSSLECDEFNSTNAHLKFEYRIW